MSNDIIVHAYASQYYDPVKAHEYYMRTRQLKGYAHRYDNTDRSRGGSSTDIIPSMKNVTNYSSEVADRAQTVSSLTNQISNLRNVLNGLSAAEKKVRASQIRQEIKDLRAKLQTARQNLRDSQQYQRQNESGTSTSGFNEKGKAAAERLKSQMQSDITNGTKQLDDEFLPQIEAIKKRVTDRSGGSDNSEIKSAISQLSGEITRRKKKLREDLQAKYKSDIEELRKDDSNYTYWDKRNAS